MRNIRKRPGKRRLRTSGGKRVYKLHKPIVKPIYQVSCEHQFAIFGCWGVGCEPSSGQWRIARDIQKKPNIEFIITAGDNIYDNNTTIKNFFPQNVDQCYRKPMYAAVGNHDLEYIQDQMDYPGEGGWHLPARNYMMNINDDIRIVVIDTNPLKESVTTYTKHIPEGGEEEYARSLGEFQSFVKDIEQECLREKKYTICVGHHPMITNRHKEKRGFHATSLRELEEEFRVILSCCDLYVCADEHNLQHLLFEEGGLKLNQFILGGGGGKPDKTILEDYPRQTKFAYGYHGYGIFDVNAKTMTIRCLDEDTGTFMDRYTYKIE